MFVERCVCGSFLNCHRDQWRYFWKWLTMINADDYSVEWAHPEAFMVYPPEPIWQQLGLVPVLMTRNWWRNNKPQVDRTGHPSFRVIVKYFNELKYDPPGSRYFLARWLADGANFKVVGLYNEPDNTHPKRTRRVVFRELAFSGRIVPGSEMVLNPLFNNDQWVAKIKRESKEGEPATIKILDFRIPRC